MNGYIFFIPSIVMFLIVPCPWHFIYRITRFMTDIYLKKKNHYKYVTSYNVSLEPNLKMHYSCPVDCLYCDWLSSHMSLNYHNRSICLPAVSLYFSKVRLIEKIVALCRNTLKWLAAARTNSWMNFHWRLMLRWVICTPPHVITVNQTNKIYVRCSSWRCCSKRWQCVPGGVSGIHNGHQKHADHQQIKASIVQLHFRRFRKDLRYVFLFLNLIVRSSYLCYVKLNLGLIDLRAVHFVALQREKKTWKILKLPFSFS